MEEIINNVATEEVIDATAKAATKTGGKFLKKSLIVGGTILTAYGIWRAGKFICKKIASRKTTDVVAGEQEFDNVDIARRDFLDTEDDPEA